MPSPVVYSSSVSTWRTPPSLLAALKSEFNGGLPFDLDPAASGPGDSQGVVHYTEAMDGLALPWFGSVFVNPPYARGITRLWVEKAAREVQLRRATQVVALLPARTDQKWFRDQVLGLAADLLFLIGRVRFLGEGGEQHGAPFPSIVVRWHQDHIPTEVVRYASPCSVRVMETPR